MDDRDLPNNNSEQFESSSDVFIDEEDNIDELHDAFRIEMKQFVGEHSDKLNLFEKSIRDDGKKHRFTQLDKKTIGIDLQPVERALIPSLVQTTNDFFNKIVIIFSILCDEINELERVAQKIHYPYLAGFGDSGSVEWVDIEHVELKGAKKTVKFNEEYFVSLYEFCERCNSVAINLVRQLSSLYNRDQKIYQSTFRTVHLLPVWQSLGDLLRILVTIDAIFRVNPKLGIMFQDLRGEILKTNDDSSKDDHVVEEFLEKLEKNLFSSKLFDTCVDQNFDYYDEKNNQVDDEDILVTENIVFLDHFLESLQLMGKDLSAEWKAASKEMDSFPTYECEKKFVTLSCLFILHSKLVPPNIPPDLTVFKVLWQLQTSIPVVSLYGNAFWLFDDFLSQQNLVFQKPKSLLPKSMTKFRKEYISKMVASLEERIPSYIRLVGAWSIQMEEKLDFSGKLGKAKEIYHQYLALYTRALSLAYRVKRVLDITFHLHLVEQIPMSRKIVTRYIARCIQLLKVIQDTCLRKLGVVAHLNPLIFSDMKSEILKTLTSWRERLETRKMNNTKTDRKNNKKTFSNASYLDIDAALVLLGTILQGSQSMSFTRYCVSNIALSVIECKEAGGSLFKVEELVQIEKHLQLMKTISSWQKKLDMICDCSVIYWQARNFLPLILKDIFISQKNTNLIIWVMKSYGDCKILFRDVVKIGEEDDLSYETKSKRVKNFEDSLLKIFNHTITLPLCRHIEDSLRLHQHAIHMDFMKEKALPKRGEIRSVQPFLDLPPIQIVDTIVFLREKVGIHLERQFYDMTVLTLHDWKTYTEMRKIAFENYGLEIASSTLPQGTLETGLDVLQIMRNISIFASLYNYNLNQQFFIEKKPFKGSKHLKTISIQSIANSVGTHGLGIINTCVNFTYQYLAKSFEVFSEFLFDENIKSYLAKEVRWFNKHAKDKDVQHMYPFSRAFSYNKEIRRLGEPSPGVTYLTKFRQHITKMGNALGYVRMVRSAGMHWVSNAIQFLPDLNNLPNFSTNQTTTNSNIANVDEIGEQAKENVDRVINDLSSKFEEETDYLKVLADAFHQVITNSTGAEHLDQFYMFVPSLCVNFVEASLLAKAGLARAHKGKEAYFTDDGFATGVAYLLAILGQKSKFKTLQWFQSVQKSFHEQVETYSKSIKPNHENSKKKNGGGVEEQHQDELERRIIRLKAYIREYELLEYALHGALIFFSP